MKRVIRATTEYPHITDFMSGIVHIKFCDDVHNVQMPLTAATILCESDDDLYEEDEELTDARYYDYTDKQLLELDDSIIHKIQDIGILERIVKLASDRLSGTQRQLIDDAFSKKVVVDKSDVQKVLGWIKTCNSVSYEPQHYKTQKFLADTLGKDFVKRKGDQQPLQKL